MFKPLVVYIFLHLPVISSHLGPSTLLTPSVNDQILFTSCIKLPGYVIFITVWLLLVL